MTIPFFSLAQMAATYRTEQDWLFEKLLGKLNDNRHLVLTADQGWGIQEYVNELRFQLAEKNPDIHTCFIDIKPAHTSTSFLELFFASLSQRFPDEVSCMEIACSNIDTLKLPALIAKKKKIRLAVFMANCHLFQRFRDSISFLMTMKLNLKHQKNCVFCLYGNNNSYFRDLVHYPGPLSGLGQLYDLRHNQNNHRSASVRKLFHDHKINIGYITSVRMSYIVDHHPFYLKLLSWHALIRTRQICTKAIVEEALDDLIHHFDYRFLRSVENLTPKQLSFLRALVDGNQKLHSQATIREYELGSTGNVSRLILSLERKEIIEKVYTGIVFTDPIFKEWLRRQYYGSHR